MSNWQGDPILVRDGKPDYSIVWPNKAPQPQYGIIKKRKMSGTATVGVKFTDSIPLPRGPSRRRKVPTLTVSRPLGTTAPSAVTVSDAKDGTSSDTTKGQVPAGTVKARIRLWHWRIQEGAGGAPPSQQYPIISFSHAFLPKSAHVGGRRPPNGKSWIRYCMGTSPGAAGPGSLRITTSHHLFCPGRWFGSIERSIGVGYWIIRTCTIYVSVLIDNIGGSRGACQVHATAYGTQFFCTPTPYGKSWIRHWIKCMYGFGFIPSSL